MPPGKRGTVQPVVDGYLCTSCGACSGLCPTGSIEMFVNEFGVYVPRIDSATCTDCGLCLETCPGFSFDYAGFAVKIHGALPEHVALGTSLDCYAGFSADREILDSSQSGGVISTILVDCLEKRLIDGAVVTKWSEKSPFVPETFIARDRQEILECVGSKYNPIPASGAIREILRETGRFAFVGTPCQIQGLRKAEVLFPEIGERIALYVGVHCLGVFTYHFIDQILGKRGLMREDIASFRHRDKQWRGWPCDMRITTKSGQVVNIEANESRLWPRSFFTNWRCQLCFDKANEFSDISCGDCRIPEVQEVFRREGHDTGKGLSEFVVRTARGKVVVDRLISENKLRLQEIDPGPLSASIGVAGKKLGLDTFFRVARFFRLGLPVYGVEFSNASLEKSLKWKILKPWAVFSSSRYFVVFSLSKHRWFRRFLAKIPHKVLGGINRVLSSKVEWSVFSKIPDLARKVVDDKD